MAPFERWSPRPATPSDADAVGRLLSASYPILLAGWYPPDLLARTLPFMTRPIPTLLECGTWYVVEDPTGHLAGCGGWTPEHPVSGSADPGWAHVRHFATRPDLARQGVGRSIWSMTLRKAQDRGIHRFECTSTLAAEPFYRSLGFETIEPQVVTFEPGLEFPCVRMGRREDHP